MSVGAKPLPTPKAQRHLVGGPHRGTVVELPKSQRILECGWMTAHYEIRADGRMHWTSLADAPEPAEKE